MLCRIRSALPVFKVSILIFNGSKAPSFPLRRRIQQGERGGVKREGPTLEVKRPLVERAYDAVSQEPHPK